MTDLIALLQIEAQQALVAAFAVFLRVGGMMAVLPAFGERSLPERVRLVLAIGLTLIVLPAADDAWQLSVGDLTIKLVAAEAAAGLLIGIALRLFVMALQTAGAIAAQSTSLSQLFGGGAVEAQPAIGHVFLVSGLALAVMFDFHVRVVEYVLLSYDILPLGNFVGAGDVSQWGIEQVTRAFSLAFTLAAPFVIAALIYNVALGAINRAMPQLMVAFVGAPALTLGGLLLMFIVTPILLGVWHEGLQRLLANPFGGG